MGKRGKREVIKPGNDSRHHQLPEMDINALGPMAEMAMNVMSEDDKRAFECMFQLASMGISPEDYAQFCNIFDMTNNLIGQLDTAGEDDMDLQPFGSPRAGSRRVKIKEYAPLNDASEHTLVLKIQIKGVTNPPMWREAKVPAHYNFLQLHDIIQEVTGLENCHLWQFNVQAYNDSLLIGDSENVEDVTHDAAQTPLTQFLQQKGDKLEYIYDFGDDWVFIVEVKDTLSKGSSYPVCTKIKSTLNAIDDFGGPIAYEEARKDMKEWGSLTKPQRKKRADNHGFDSAEEYIDFLIEHTFFLEEVNDHLMGM